MTKEQMMQKIVYSESLDAAIAALVEYVLAKKTIIDNNIAGEAAKIATLIGSDTAKSVRTIANEELAAQLIPASAKESLDTLQEIAAWIQNHPDDASAMNQAISDLSALVGELPSTTTATTVVGYITAEIAALAQQISGKNVGATGETGENALVTASASNNNVTVASTQKLQNAVSAAESALQASNLDFLTVSEAQALVATAITAAETPANSGE